MPLDLPPQAVESPNAAPIQRPSPVAGFSMEGTAGNYTAVRYNGQNLNLSPDNLRRFNNGETITVDVLDINQATGRAAVRQVSIGSAAILNTATTTASAGAAPANEQATFRSELAAIGFDISTLRPGEWAASTGCCRLDGYGYAYRMLANGTIEKAFYDNRDGSVELYDRAALAQGRLQVVAIATGRSELQASIDEGTRQGERNRQTELCREVGEPLASDIASFQRIQPTPASNVRSTNTDSPAPGVVAPAAPAPGTFAAEALRLDGLNKIVIADDNATSDKCEPGIELRFNQAIGQFQEVDASGAFKEGGVTLSPEASRSLVRFMSATETSGTPDQSLVERMRNLDGRYQIEVTAEAPAPAAVGQPGAPSVTVPANAADQTALVAQAAGITVAPNGAIALADGHRLNAGQVRAMQSVLADESIPLATRAQIAAGLVAANGVNTVGNTDAALATRTAAAGQIQAGIDAAQGVADLSQPTTDALNTVESALTGSGEEAKTGWAKFWHSISNPGQLSSTPGNDAASQAQTGFSLGALFGALGAGIIAIFAFIAGGRRRRERALERDNLIEENARLRRGQRPAEGGQQRQNQAQQDQRADVTPNSAVLAAAGPAQPARRQADAHGAGIEPGASAERDGAVGAVRRLAERADADRAAADAAPRPAAAQPRPPQNGSGDRQPAPPRATPASADQFFTAQSLAKAFGSDQPASAEMVNIANALAPVIIQAVTAKLEESFKAQLRQALKDQEIRLRNEFAAQLKELADMKAENERLKAENAALMAGASPAAAPAAARALSVTGEGAGDAAGARADDINAASSLTPISLTATGIETNTTAAQGEYATVGEMVEAYKAKRKAAAVAMLEDFDALDPVSTTYRNSSSLAGRVAAIAAYDPAIASNTQSRTHQERLNTFSGGDLSPIMNEPKSLGNDKERKAAVAAAEQFKASYDELIALQRAEKLLAELNLPAEAVPSSELNKAIEAAKSGQVLKIEDGESVSDDGKNIVPDRFIVKRTYEAGTAKVERVSIADLTITDGQNSAVPEAPKGGDDRPEGWYTRRLGQLGVTRLNALRPADKAAAADPAPANIPS